ncbi:type II toxin-antitoxin system PemK/MazF family toxin [Pseudarthrobacter equi]|uniref:type II toxin-antitoxin system PemK/MazF family toxin n=1 Tax=Pseudarthrobacter equi TaxID=728066 RepID=UPI0028D78CCF|nr:type II toxin-antitoxin system PemK/MazF family toxin [Pseudarthrobacter equi]
MAINLRMLGNAVRAGLRLLRNVDKPAAHQRPAPRPASQDTKGAMDGMRTAGYPGDFTGRAEIRYSPQPDGEPDPGEVVWTWVPYEEDHSRGKDRPVLIVARNGKYLLGLMLTSKDRVPAASASRDYVDVGAGGWDRQGRPSEAKLDRVLQLRPDSIRREGAVLDRARFDAVAAGLRARHGWR